MSDLKGKGKWEELKIDDTIWQVKKWENGEAKELNAGYSL